MKIREITSIIIVLIFCGNALHGQVKFGLATGMAPNHIDPGEFTISNIDDSIKYSITSTAPSWQMGTFFRLQVESVYLRGSIMAAYSNIYYDKDDLKNGIANIENIQDPNWHFNVPLELGVVIKDRFLISAGVHWSDFLRPEEENVLLNLPDTFTGLFSNSKIGYTGGVGFDIDWQVSLRLNYTYFPDLNTSIIIDGNVGHNFNYRNHHIMVNATWNFIKEGWKD